MRTPRTLYAPDNGGTFQSMKNCNCCPYGYHIDLDFIRYCEAFAKVKPSNDQLLRRDRRRSRKSLEFMLGLEHLFEHWEPTADVHSVPEVPVEIEPESPRVANITQQLSQKKESSSSHFHYTTDSHESSKSTTPSLSHHRRESKSSSNSPPETSAFVRDILDDVVSDFERTFERTKTKDKQKRNCYSWEEYIDIIDSCVSGNKRQNDDENIKISVSTVPPPPPPRRHEREIADGTSETQALFKIRQQMALSLRRMKDLEEQVKNVPLLQKQVITLNEEKLKLQRLLQQKEDELTKAKHVAQVVTASTPTTASVPKHVHLRNKSTSPISFTPQRISPISLESLGSRINTNSQLPEQSKGQVIKRNVGTMCHLLTRDMAVGTTVQITRSIGTNPTNTSSLRDVLYTQKELDNIVQISVSKHEEKQKISRKLNLVSIGTQMILTNETSIRDSATQTSTSYKLQPQKISIGITAVQKSHDATTTCKPETRSVGSSDHRTIDKICDQCSIPKCNVGCGPDTTDELKKYISLKQIEMPPRSVSFSLDGSEKLNIQRKTISTQIQIATNSIGVQRTPISHNQSSQSLVNSVSRQTDTRDLIKLCNSQTHTDSICEPRKITNDFASNTDIIQTIDYGVNTKPLNTVRNSSSNTEHIYKKDVSCGNINQPPHILIACSDNYCDSCKDAIKNLAKDFSKSMPPSPLLGRDSRIPRPKTSPRPIQKKFVRQNTYTVDLTPSSSSSPEKFSESERLDKKTISCSLDSIRDPHKNVEYSMSQSYTKDEVIDSFKYAKIDSAPSTMVNLQGILAKEEIRLETSWVKEPSPKLSDEPLPSPPLATEEVQSTNHLPPIHTNKESQDEPSHRSNHQQAMLLNKIATSVLMPREKSSPSKEMKAALKVINDSLQKFTSKSSSLKSANSIVQIEWFRISSTDTANPNDVEDYLDCFEEFSNVLLKYVVNLIDSNGNTAMHYAVSHGNFDVVSILLDSKVCNVNQMNNAGYTCVMLVSLAKLKNSAHRTVVQRLFQMADVNIRAKKHCQTALMLAVSHGNLDMVELLLSAGADINIQDEDGSTALMCAAEHGRIDIVKHLLSQSDCDSLIQDVDNSTAFKIAWQAGHRDIGLLLYVHEQMLRSKLPGGSCKTSPEHHRSTSTSPRQQKHESP